MKFSSAWVKVYNRPNVRSFKCWRVYKVDNIIYCMETQEEKNRDRIYCGSKGQLISKDNFEFSFEPKIESNQKRMQIITLNNK